MRTYSILAAILAVITLVGCGGEPQRGPILKDTEKFKDSDKIFREREYYKDRRGRKITHGLFKQYFSNGNVQFDYPHKDGKYHGVITEYYADGKKKNIVEYKEGLFDGKFESFFQSGKLKVSGQNVKGLQDGTWTHYDETGKVTKTVEWDKGKKLGK
jgi:antitoxin component YwqK of YwqJK toxin-antitoxin module